MFRLEQYLYDAPVIIHFQEDETKVLIFLILAILPLGALADVLQYVTSACSVSDKEEDRACTGHQLYFLVVPISAIAGLIAAGYFPSHPDSIITTLMTGHMRVPSNAVVRLIILKNMDKAACDLASTEMESLDKLFCCL